MKRKTLSARTMGPGKERFAVADLIPSPRDFLGGELAKPPARRFEAICFDARRLTLPKVVEWIRGLDRAQDELDTYIRRVVIVKSARARLPKGWRERPDITWIATSDPADPATIYRRAVTEQFQAVLDFLGAGKKKKRRS